MVSDASLRPGGCQRRSSDVSLDCPANLAEREPIHPLMACLLRQMVMVRGKVFMHDARLWVGQPIVKGESSVDPLRDVHARGMVAADQSLWRKSDGY